MAEIALLSYEFLDGREPRLCCLQDKEIYAFVRDRSVAARNLDPGFDRRPRLIEAVLIPNCKNPRHIFVFCDLRRVSPWPC